VALKCHDDPYLSLTDTALKKLGVERNAKFIVSDVLPALQILHHNVLIGTLPERSSKIVSKKFKLVFKPLPFEIPKVEIKMVWHKQIDNDPGHRWLREIILNTMRSD